MTHKSCFSLYSSIWNSNHGKQLNKHINFSSNINYVSYGSICNKFHTYNLSWAILRFCMQKWLPLQSWFTAATPFKSLQSLPFQSKFQEEHEHEGYLFSGLVVENFYELWLIFGDMKWWCSNHFYDSFWFQRGDEQLLNDDTHKITDNVIHFFSSSPPKIRPPPSCKIHGIFTVEWMGNNIWAAHQVNQCESNMWKGWARNLKWKKAWCRGVGQSCELQWNHHSNLQIGLMVH